MSMDSLSSEMATVLWVKGSDMVCTVYRCVHGVLVLGSACCGDISSDAICSGCRGLRDAVPKPEVNKIDFNYGVPLFSEFHD